MLRILQLLLMFLIVPQAYGQSLALESYWDDGLQFRSPDKLYRFSVGGRVHYDIAFSKQSPALDSVFDQAGTKVEVRRARLSFEGTINKALEYEFEFTFGETIEYADMYFAFLRVPFLERLTVGHFREPFGLEEMTSSNAIVFMERSLTSTFGPSRNTGFMVQKQFFQDKLRGYAGVFRITDDLASDLTGKGNHSFSSRWVYTPIVIEDDQVLHLGLSFNRVTPNGQSYKVDTNNEVNTNPDYISTGKLTGVQTVNQVGGEAGLAKGPVTIQSEWVQSLTKIAPATGPDPTQHQYRSFYLLTSYFLKGGRRGYSKSRNRFSSIDLTQPKITGSLRGAWEAGLRYSFIDLSDAGQAVNQSHNFTAGLNWYYNTKTRFMTNYVYSLFNNGTEANTLQFRVQVTF